MYPFYPPPLWGTDWEAWVRDAVDNPLTHFVSAIAPASGKLLRKAAQAISRRFAASPIAPATQPCCS